MQIMYVLTNFKKVCFKLENQKYLTPPPENSVKGYAACGSIIFLSCSPHLDENSHLGYDF